MSDIKFPFWQGLKKNLIDKLDGTHAERIDIGNTALGYGDITADAWGIQKVSLARSVFHGMWTFDIPANMWFMYENGAQVYTSTNIASVNGAGTLTTSETKTALILESREAPRYQPNRGHLFSTALWCPSKLNNGVREWGLKTAENGVYFRLKSNGLLYAVRRSGNTEKAEQLIDTSNVENFNVEKGNVYDIQYQWRGVGNYKFFINLVLVHEFNNLGTLTELSMENPALPVYYAAQRITQDVSMSVGCADICSENGATEVEQYGSVYAEAVNATTNTPVICIKNPLLINGKTNTRTVTLARITVNGSKKATFKAWITRDPTAITGATFVSRGGGSITETDSPDIVTGAVRATSVAIEKMKLVTTINVEATSSRSVDNPYQGRIEFSLVRGDYLVITATGATVLCDVVVEFGEQI